MGSAERRYFSKALKPGSTIIDVGANVGLYTLIFSHLVGSSGKVISLEPSADLFSQLLRNLELNHISNVTAHALGADSTTGLRYFEENALNSGDNRLSSSPDDASNRTKIQVTALDDLVGSQKVDWVKIDVQGWEPNVLQGMSRIIHQNPDLKIFFEFWPQGIRQTGGNPEEFLGSFQACGLKLFSPGSDNPLDEGARKAIAKINRYTNLLGARTTP